MVDTWSTHEVCLWLEQNSLSEAKQIFFDEVIDGETLLGLTENMVARLFPKLKQQVKFLSELEKIKNSLLPKQNDNPPANSAITTTKTPVQTPTTAWPTVYTPPTLSPEVREALAKRDPAFYKKDKSHIRTALITLLFDDITRYTWYPSHKMYSDVLGTLITRHPFLMDGSLSGFETLLECLKNKFKKERRTLVHMDKVLEMRQKYGKRHQTTDGGNHCCLKRKQQLTTEVVEGEDGQSISEHLKAIDAELKKIRPNFANIEWRMERTLHTRTSIYKTSSAAEFFQQFPFLKHSRLLLHEMRLRFGQDLDSLFSMFIDEAAEKIVETSKGPLKTVFSSAILQANPLRSTCMRNNAAVLLLPTVMKANSKYLFCINEEPLAPTPTVVMRCENSPLTPDMVSIKMDGECVIAPSPDIDATLGLLCIFLCIFSLYFLFDIQYPKEARHTLHFFERRLNLAVAKPSLPVLRVEKMLQS